MKISVSRTVMAYGALAPDVLDFDPFGGPGWAGFVVIEFVYLDSHTDDLVLIDVHAFCRRCVEQFVRGRERRIGEPEKGAFVWVTWSVVFGFSVE